MPTYLVGKLLKIMSLSNTQHVCCQNRSTGSQSWSYTHTADPACTSYGVHHTVHIFSIISTIQMWHQQRYCNLKKTQTWNHHSSPITNTHHHAQHGKYSLHKKTIHPTDAAICQKLCLASTPSLSLLSMPLLLPLWQTSSPPVEISLVVIAPKILPL